VTDAPPAWKNPLAWLPHSIAESALSTAPSAFPDDADLAAAWAHLQERLSEAQRLVVSTPVNKNPIDYAAGTRHLMVLLAVGIDAAVPPMTFSTNELEDGARAATGLDDFGSSYYREGLDRTVDALNTEAELNDLGQVIQHATISNALIQRLKIIDAYKARPEIADEVIDGPIVILGLPRTGTTALGQLISGRSAIQIPADLGVSGAHTAARDRHTGHRSAHRAGRRGHRDDRADVS